MSTENIYEVLTGHTNRMLKQKKNQLQMISLLRFFTFAAIVSCIYLAVSTHPVFWALCGVLLLVFLMLMKQHALTDRELSLNRHLNAIAKHGAAPFYKTIQGEEYGRADHPYSADLDVFGPGSVFQYMNVTETAGAEEALAHRLLNPLSTAQAIREQQQAVRELAGSPEFMTSLRAHSALIGYDRNRDTQLTTWLNAAAFFTSKQWINVMLYLVPLFSLFALFAAFSYSYYTPVVFSILLNWFMAGVYLKRTNKLHALVGKQKAMLENFSKLNQLVLSHEFSCETLHRIKQSFTESNAALRQLSTLAATFDQRLNTMLGPVLNSLFLFDLQCVYRIETWQLKNAVIIQQWLRDIAELEMLTTLGTYAFNHPGYIYPEVKEQGIYFEAEELIHPLIRGKSGVANTFCFDDQNKVFIVTGSNMSGKSTFLRTIGASLLTGMIGLPVHASRLVFSPVKLLSSMRIADSLQDSTSYFHAELKRLKLIMDETEKAGLPSLLFIDEMLKGTNSKEKLEGSVQIVEKLVTKPCVSFIATHDLALGRLEERFPEEVVNYSFESAIINEELVFDYRIKKGVASSTNATFLLKKMGIV